MKNNLSYYSRMVNAHNHPKFKMLRAKYGWEGEGRFWALNDIVAEAENCKLDVSKKYIRGSVANDLGFNLEEFDEFLKYLVDDCELFYYEGDSITNDHLQETLEGVMEDREESRRRYEERKKKTSGEKGKTSGEKIKNTGEKAHNSENFGRSQIQSRVKESKVKKSKEEREEAPRTDPESSESEIQSLEPEEDIATSCSNILSLALSAPDDSTAAEETESVSRKFERPSLQQVKEHFELSGFPISEGENFWSYYDGRDWEDNRGSPIAFWRSLVIGWMNKSKHFINTGNGNDSAIDNKTSFNSRLNPTVDRDEFSQSVRTYQERYG